MSTMLDDVTAQPHLRIVSSKDALLLRARGPNVIKALYHPNLGPVVASSRRVEGLPVTEAKQITDTVYLRLGVFVYTMALNVTTLDADAQTQVNENRMDIENIVYVRNAGQAAMELSYALDEILGIEDSYDKLELTVPEDVDRLVDAIVSNRTQANLANLLLRAVKPDSATRASENDSARSRAKQGQLQVVATLPKITNATASALHAGFTHAVAERGPQVLLALRVLIIRILLFRVLY